MSPNHRGRLSSEIAIRIVARLIDDQGERHLVNQGARGAENRWIHRLDFAKHIGHHFHPGAALTGLQGEQTVSRLVRREALDETLKAKTPQQAGNILDRTRFRNRDQHFEIRQVHGLYGFARDARPEIEERQVDGKGAESRQQTRRPTCGQSSRSLVRTAADEPEVGIGCGHRIRIRDAAAGAQKVEKGTGNRCDAQAAVEIRAAKVRVDKDDALPEPRQVKADRGRERALARAAFSAPDGPDFKLLRRIRPRIRFNQREGLFRSGEFGSCSIVSCYHGRMRPLIIAGISLAATACGMGSKPPTPDFPPWKLTKDASGVEVRLLEKPPYTYLYALDGTLRQIRFDGNGDHRPDVFAHFSGRNTPDRLEIDENRDGKIDRWEEYNAAGVMVRFSTSAKGGAPERFIEVDPVTKATLRVETDADHDGRRERLEIFVGGRLSRAEIDTNGDGKSDRFQDWSEGHLASEEIDRDGDGRADIRILRTKAGAISKVERLVR